MLTLPESAPPQSGRHIHPWIERLGAYSWRLIAIGVVGLAGLWLLSRMRVVVLPIVIAVFLTRALSPLVSLARRHRWHPGLAAAGAMLAFLVVIAGLAAVVVPSIADETDSIGPTVTAALDDVEDWLVDDAPINVSRDSIERLREQGGERLDQLLSSSGGDVFDSATLAAEVMAGVLLSMLLTFFMLRDGKRFVDRICLLGSPPRQLRLRRMADSAWKTLGGYLRGATLLGVVEAVLIGGTLLIAGGRLVVPVVLITFVGAYVPIVGAVGAGAVAVLVALVTGGTGAAVAVAVVALVVQQLDNDLLAPIIYGKQLSLHPVVILLGVVAGGALFGLAGTVLAVPVIAVAANAFREERAVSAEERFAT